MPGLNEYDGVVEESLQAFETDYNDVIEELQQAFAAEETPYFDPRALLAAADNYHDSLEAWEALQLSVDAAINNLAFPPIARSGFRSVAKYVDGLSQPEPISVSRMDVEETEVGVGLVEKKLRETYQFHAQYQSQRINKLDDGAYGYRKEFERASKLTTQVANAVNEILCELYRYLKIHFGFDVPELGPQAPLSESQSKSERQVPELESHLDRILKARLGDPSIRRIEIAKNSPSSGKDYVALDEDGESHPGTFALDARPDAVASSHSGQTSTQSEG